MRNIFKSYKKKRAKEQNVKLATLGFALGAAAALEDDDSSIGDVLACGVGGVLVAGLFNLFCPETSKNLKSLL